MADVLFMAEWLVTAWASDITVRALQTVDWAARLSMA